MPVKLVLPGVNEEALAILATRNLPCDHIVRLEGDAILYVNQQMRARTCWLHRSPSGRLRTTMEEGFPAEAPPGWHEPRPGD